MRHKKTFQVFFSLVSTLLLTLAIAGQTSALGSATLNMVPNSGSFNPGNEFTVTIKANTGSSAVNAIEVGIQYNPSLATLVKSEFPSSYMYKRDDSKSGLACVTVATMGSTVSGENIVAYLTFRTLSSGTLNFNYITSQNTCYNGSPGTSILNTSQQNIWNGNTSAGSFSLGSGNTVNPTPTPKPSSSSGATTTPKTTSNTSSSTSQSGGTTPSSTTTGSTKSQPSVQGESSSGYMIAIKVVDENNNIVVGAKVTINGITAITDASGVASFTNITPGKHEAKIEYSGKKFSKLIEVKGASTLEPQTFSVKSTKNNIDYSKFAIAGGAVLLGIIIIYYLIKQIKKTKDHHMDGAPIIGGPTGTPPSVTPGTQGPTNIGTVVGPTQINQTVANNNENQGLSNGQY